MLDDLTALAKMLDIEPSSWNGEPIPARHLFFEFGPVGTGNFSAYFSINSRMVEVRYKPPMDVPEDVLIPEGSETQKEACVPVKEVITEDRLLAAFGDAMIKYDDAILAEALAHDLPFHARIAIADAMERQADIIDAEANRLLTRAKDRRSLSTKQYLRAEK